MSTEMQRDALAALAEVWALSPAVRLGQLMAHLGLLGEAHLGHGLGELEDDEMMAILYRHKAELTARLPAVPDSLSARPGAAISVSGG